MSDVDDSRSRAGEPEDLVHVETRRRLRATTRELGALVRRLADLGVVRRPAAGSPGEPRLQLRELLEQALLADAGPSGLKRGAARRIADKIGQYLLWSRVGSTPVIHELITLLPWWLSNMPGPVVAELRDIGLRHLLNGAVLPVQVVWQEILAAREVYLGHCACRSAGIADDLRAGETLCVKLSAAELRLLHEHLLGRIDRWRASGERATDPRYRELFGELALLRGRGDARRALERLIEGTYPDWEILPVHEGYTPNWIRSMHANRKAHRIDAALALELATLLYLVRGTMFTSMRLVDTPYAICSCPTPESGGGCVLTNWFYFGASNASLVPGEGGPGRRRDAAGEVLPCRFFPIRRQRECMGCGCRFERARPRGVKDVLAEVDALLAAHREASR